VDSGRGAVSVSPRGRAPVLQLGVLLLVLVAACSKSLPTALRALQDAPVTPAAGLGTLRLGDTLESVTQRFGAGTANILVTDDLWVELSYAGGDLLLLFALDEKCRDALRAGGSLVQRAKALVESPESVAAQPACAAAPLSSLAITTEDPANAHFKGATDRGIRLGSDRDALLAAQGSGGERPISRLFAGDRATYNRFDAAYYPNGVGILLGESEGKMPWTVRRIMVFSP
jgi:hypothetical protein